MVVDGGSWSDGTATIYSSDMTSQTGNFQTGKGPELAFNGDIGLPACASEDKAQFLKYAPTGGIDYTSIVEIYTHMSGGYIELNGTQVVSTAATDWQTLATGSGTINEIVVVGDGTNRAVISAIRVDGVILTDSGPAWDQSAEWLANTTFSRLSDPGSMTGIGLYDGVAEGDPGQQPENYIRMLSNGEAVLTHTFLGVTRVEISVSASQTTPTIQFDDGPELTFIPAANTSYNRIEIANPPPNFSKLTLRSKNSTAYFSKIWVNGLALVDPSIANPNSGQTNVEYQTNGGQGTIISVNTDDNTILLSSTGDP